jgi:hypothetical protein
MNRYVGHAFEEIPLQRIWRALRPHATTVDCVTNEAEAKAIRDEREEYGLLWLSES